MWPAYNLLGLDNKNYQYEQKQSIMIMLFFYFSLNPTPCFTHTIYTSTSQGPQYTFWKDNNKLPNDYGSMEKEYVEVENCMEMHQSGLSAEYRIKICLRR